MNVRKIIREEIKKLMEADYYDRYPDFFDPQYNPQMGFYRAVGFPAYGEMVKEQEVDGMKVDFVAEDMKPYKFYLLCDKLCQLKGVEVKNQMIEDAIPVSKEEFIENCSYSESLLEYETISPQSDPSMGFYKSKVDGTPCYFVQYAGFEFIFTLDNPNPDEYWVEEMFDESGEKIYEDTELKNISDDDEYWDRVKIIAKNKSGEEVGYAILDMAITPETEFANMDDEHAYTDDEIEQHFPEDFAAKLEHLEVYPKFRKSGYAKELMEAVVKYIKSRDYKTLYLIASPIGVEPKISLDALSNFYKKYGLEVVKDFGNAHDMVAQLREKDGEEDELPLIQRAREMAVLAHGGQTYGDKPYSFHLDQVAAVAKELGYSDDIIIACYLHDTLEDTDLKQEEIAEVFGPHIARVVHAVKDEDGINRKERKAKTYVKIAAIPDAIAVKLCDRIANVRNALKSGKDKLLKMYKKEHPDFEAALRKGSHEKAWEILDSLLS